MASAGGLALATTERVVDRVHGDTAGLGSDPFPAVTAGFAYAYEFSFGVTYLAQGCPAVDRDPPHLSGREPQRREIAFLSDKLHAHSGTPRQLATATRFEFDVVHNRTNWDETHGQSVTWANVCSRSTLHLVTDRHLGWSEYVSLLAVVVVK